MITKLYSIYDKKVAVYGKIFPAINDADATRQLHSACQDKTIQLGMYPADFDLYAIAEFDSESGVINQKGNVTRFVVSATSLTSMEATKNAV